MRVKNITYIYALKMVMSSIDIFPEQNKMTKEDYDFVISTDERS